MTDSWRHRALMKALGAPCQHCGDSLTLSTQSTGWPGVCKPCHKIARTCLVCAKNGGSIRNGRCLECTVNYDNHLKLMKLK